MVDVTGSLNERQLAVLRWIGDGCPAGVMADHTYKTTAVALQGRRLVTVSKRQGTWSATLTESGQHYLQHGRHPDRLDEARVPIQRRSSSIILKTPPPTPGPTSSGRTPSPPVTATASEAMELMRRVQADGGTSRILDPDEETRARYRRAIHAAKQHRLIPEGYTLRHTGRNQGDLIVCLYPDDVAYGTDWNRVRLKKRGPGVPPATSQGVAPLPASADADDSPTSAAPPVNRISGPVDRLIEDVQRAGGVLTVPRPNWVNGIPTGVDYEALVRSAVQYRKIPAGMRLTTTAKKWPDMEIRLEPAIPGTDVAPRPVPVPDRVTSYHPVVAAFRDQPQRHEISAAMLSRCCRILHGLVTEAERRGYAVAVAPGPSYDPYSRGWASSRDGHLVFTVNGTEHPLRISEQGMPSRSQWARSHGPRDARYPTTGGNGRLRIELLSYAIEAGRTGRWSDGARAALAGKLPAVLMEMEIRSAEHAHRAHEREREEAERQRRRELAIARATARLVEADRARHFAEQVDRWELADRGRRYVEAMRAEITARAAKLDAPSLEVEAALEWLGWAEQHIGNLDPLAGPLSMPAPPAATAEALRPFL